MGILISALCSFKKRKPTIVIVSIVLLLLIGWEVFEVVFEVVETKDVGYTINTVSDILIGTLSAFSAILWYKARQA